MNQQDKSLKNGSDKCKFSKNNAGKEITTNLLMMVKSKEKKMISLWIFKKRNNLKLEIMIKNKLLCKVKKI